MFELRLNKKNTLSFIISNETIDYASDCERLPSVIL